MTGLTLHSPTDSAKVTRQAAATPNLRTVAWVLAVLAITLTGCKAKPKAVDDETLVSTIQSTLASDTAIAGQSVQVQVQGGVATLSGTVANDAQRALAARDAAGVAGVLKVVNSIGVAGETASAAPPPTPAPATPAVAGKPSPMMKAPVAAAPVPSAPQPAPETPHTPAPIERPVVAAPAPAPAPAPQPPAPPQPVYKTVTITAGTTIPVRVTQTLDSGTTQPDTTFSGVVAADVVIDGAVAFPAGTNVQGHVDEVKDAAHFKGSSLLTVSLQSITRKGEHIVVTTDPYTVTGKGRGTNTAEKTGGGAAVGAILGGIFGGGKGAAIGAAAGAGAGAGSNAITRGQQVQIASESVVRFHLSAPVTVKVRIDGGDKRPEDGGLQQRTPQ